MKDKRGMAAHVVRINRQKETFENERNQNSDHYNKIVLDTILESPFIRCHILFYTILKCFFIPSQTKHFVIFCKIYTISFVNLNSLEIRITSQTYNLNCHLFLKTRKEFSQSTKRTTERLGTLKLKLNDDLNSNHIDFELIKTLLMIKI